MNQNVIVPTTPQAVTQAPRLNEAGELKEICVKSKNKNDAD